MSRTGCGAKTTWLAACAALAFAAGASTAPAEVGKDGSRRDDRLVWELSTAAGAGLALPLQAAPRSLALADLNGDRALDLAVGYAHESGGFLALWLGEPAVQKPSFEAFARGEARPRHAPFGGLAAIHPLGETPEILLAGDFDADGHDDLAATAVGSRRLHFLLGADAAAELLVSVVELPGAVALAVAGQLNRHDGLEDLLVAVATDEGARLLVYEGWEGAATASPEVVELPGLPERVLLGGFDRDPYADAALLIGGRLTLLAGRDRRLDATDAGIARAVPAPTLRAVEGARGIADIALGAPGNRAGEPYRELLARSAEGWSAVRWEPEEERRALAPRLAAASRRAAPEPPHARTARGVVAEAGARLDADGAEDRVLLLADRQAPLVASTAAAADGLVVSSTGDQPDGQVGDGFCDTGNATIGFTGLCTLRAAIQEHNTGAFGRVIIGGGSSADPIRPLSSLPAITLPVDLLGGFVDGSQCFACPIGIRLLNVGGNSVMGMVLQSFSNAIQVDNGDGNLIAANRIGTDAGASMAVGPAAAVLLLNSSNNEVSGNVVAGFVTMQGAGSHTNTVSANHLGVSPTSGADLLFGGLNGLVGGGDLTSANSNTIAGGGVEISSGGGDGAMVVDNSIGTDDAGASVVGTSDFGIRLVQVTGATVRQNRVVGQSEAGIAVSGADPAVVSNVVGLDGQGATALPNNVGISVNASAATIHSNVVSGNTDDGIELVCTGGVCEIRKNLIGTDVTGAQGVGNGLYGVRFGSLGGRVDLLENVIAANGSGGVYAGSGSQHSIAGNTIGAAAGGVAPLPNMQHGILLQSQNSTILDNTVVATQKLAGLQGHGIEIKGAQATGNILARNEIGVGAGGAGMGNQGHGVLINVGAANNLIGDPAIGGNTIAHNGGGGAVVGSGTGNTILGNSIFDNGGLGIDLGADGVTANDPGDGDAGANNLQNAPEVLDLGATKSVSLHSHPNESFTIELFSDVSCAPPEGEARTLLGSVPLTTDGAGNGSVQIPAGARSVTATATRDATGDTSELSTCVEREARLVNSQRDRPEPAGTSGDGACSTGFLVAISGQQVPECTLRAAIEETNAAPGADAILFDPDGPGEAGATPNGVYVIRPGAALPAITGPVRIGGAPGSEQVDLDGSIAGSSTSGLVFAAANNESEGSDDSEVRALAVHGFAEDGISVASDSFRLTSSFLGTDRSGTADLGNGGDGISFTDVVGGEVGGRIPEERNVISGNSGSGVKATRSGGLRIQGGNLIGTAPDGQTELGNGRDGVELMSTAGSWIGAEEVGVAPNVIGGNDGVGIGLTASNENRIVRNVIGEKPGGLGSPNEEGGVAVDGGSRKNVVRLNEIKDNSGDGVLLSGLATGSNVISTNELTGNAGNGVLLFGGARGNDIKFNEIFDNQGGDGILLQDGATVRNRLTGNQIGGHAAGLAIDLGGDGVTPNGPSDASFPNHRQAFPVITFYDASGVAEGTLEGAPLTPYRIELYLNASCDPSGHGEAERLVAAASGTTDSAGHLDWRAFPGVGFSPFLTALAIRELGPGGDDLEHDTSELSECFEIDLPQDPSPTLLIHEVDADTGALPRELVELWFRGAGAASLSGTVVVFFDGDTDASYAAFDLDGFFTDAQGRFVLGNADTPGVDLVFDDFLLQDGVDAVAVYQANDTDFPDGTPVTTTDLLDAVVYGTGSADPGLAVLLAPDQPQLDEDAAGRAPLHSLQRCPDGAGDPRETGVFAVAPPTPDDQNRCVQCELIAFDSALSPDPMVLGLVRENRSTPVPDATVFFEVVAGPSAGITGAAATDAGGRVDFDYLRPAGACGADTVEASGMFAGAPFVCRAQTCAWCPDDADLLLLVNPAPGPALFQACSSITARDAFVVGAGDTVTFRAQRVVFGPGFQVAADGSLVVRTGDLP